MVGVVPDLNETLRYAGDCSVPWNEDGVIWITSENAAGERGVQAIDVTTDLISLFRDAAGGSTTFAQATDTNKASLVTAAGEYSHALFNATSPSDHYAMSPSAAINTEAAHSFGGVLLCSTTSAAGFMGRYVSATDRNYVGRAGVSPLDNWSYMRGASIINSPVTTTKKFAFMCSFDPAAGALGTIKLMVGGKIETPVPVASGTGSPAAAFKLGSASSTGAIAMNMKLWDAWAMPFDWFEATPRGRKQRRAWRTYVEGLHGIDCFPVAA